MTLLWYVLVFMLGAAIGSFLNVLISRSIEGKDWVHGRSRCDVCGTPLAWYDMIPVFSYALYRGRSRCCGKPFSPQHIIVEGLIGSLFVWWLAVGSLFFRLVTEPLATVQPLFWLITGVILLSIFVTDLFYGLIPSPFVTIGAVFTLVYRLGLSSAGAYQWKDFWLSIVSALLAWGFFFFLRAVTRGKGMGDGDVILAFFLGLLLGWPRIAVGILSSFVIGAAVSLILVAFGSKKMRSTIPFGPFMIIGTAVALIWGGEILRLIVG